MNLRFLLAPIACLSLACGGSTPPPADNPTAAAPASAEPAAAAAADTSAAAPSASASTDTPQDTTPAAPPAPARQAPTLDGSIAGKPFHAVAACVVGIGKDPGTAYVEIYAVKDFDVSKSCGRLPPDKDARKIGVILTWSDGASTDLATLKGGNEPQLFVMQGTGNPKKFSRKDTGKDFKPKGTITVVHGGSKKGDVAHIKIDLTAGKDKLQGEIDVDLVGDLPS